MLLRFASRAARSRSLHHKCVALQGDSSGNRHYGDLHRQTFDVEHLQRNSTPVMQYVNAYRVNGHRFADLDPLGYTKPPAEFVSPLDLRLKYQDEIAESVDKNSCYISELANDVGLLEEYLQRVYRGKAGVEFDHVKDPAERDWLYYNFEKAMLTEVTNAEKKNLYTMLVQTEALDHYLHKKFSTFKRYAGEGAESAVTFLRTLFAKASELDVKQVVLGMPHRGRLNVLCNLLDLPPRDLFRKIMGFNDMPDEWATAQDDVVSHVSVSATKAYVGTGCREKPITVSMVHNPSHLEAANPVSMGKTRAKQDDARQWQSVLNVQIHGDSAFSAQGIVYESLALSGVPKFAVGGTVHAVVNNQIGYTTSVRDSRGGLYCTEIVRAFNMPVVHVNSDDPETVHRIAKFAAEYRQVFGKDIMIDLICYRKYGHNEVDEPAFTQPLLYDIVRKTRSLPQKYHDTLVGEGIVKSEEYEALRKRVWGVLDKEYEAAAQQNGAAKSAGAYTDPAQRGSRAFTGQWKDMLYSSVAQVSSEGLKTGVKKPWLQQIARQSVTLPPDFNVHARLKKFHIDARLNDIDQGVADWATAEIAAYASLIEQGFNVRLTGQDVERGTFSQRHAVFIDQKTEKEWSPIKEFAEATHKGRFDVYNSPLTEAAVVGYEYGYSLESPNNFSIWEAQFGDFFNVAQPVIDTFMVASEAKWARQSSLTLLLPHGFDGAGPEHSTSRVERFLQLGNTNGVYRHYTRAEFDAKRAPEHLLMEKTFFYATHRDVNFQIVWPSNAASLFHALRRQMLRDYRKPMMLVSAKTLLRHPSAVVPFDALGEGTSFTPVWPYHPVLNDVTTTVLVGCGKVVHDAREQLKDKKHVAILSLEELLPFPEKELKAELAKADRNNVKLVFVQEEPLNGGAFLYSEPHLARIIHDLGWKNTQIQYIGRRAIATPATGVPAVHKLESQTLLKQLRDL